MVSSSVAEREALMLLASFPDWVWWHLFLVMAYGCARLLRNACQTMETCMVHGSEAA
jgi:hypothetical protein